MTARTIKFIYEELVGMEAEALNTLRNARSRLHDYEEAETLCDDLIAEQKLVAAECSTRYAEISAALQDFENHSW